MRNEGFGLRRLRCHSSFKYRQQKTSQPLKKSERGDQQSSHSWIGPTTSLRQVNLLKFGYLRLIFWKFSGGHAQLGLSSPIGDS